jgi:hypothetical protein
MTSPPKHFPDCLDKPPAERAVCYRAYAEQMQALAAAALTEETKVGYLQMAEEWLALANDLDEHHAEVTFIVEPEVALLLRKQSP